MFPPTPQNRVLFPRVLAKPVIGGFVAYLVLMVFGLALAVSLLVSLASPATASAATNSALNFQARLENSAGNIAPDGNYFVEFNLYTASSGGSTVWTERYQGSAYSCAFGSSTGATNNKITVRNGYLTANLGTLCTFPSTINWDQDMWVTLNIGGTGGAASWDGEMSPRLKLTGVPYAFRAGQLATLNGANTSTLGFASQTGARSILLPDESGTICIQSSTICGFASSSGSANYIQNQNASPQTSSNFWISGTGRADGSLQAPSFDTATGVALGIGGTNATSINLGKTSGSTNIATTINGTATFKNNSDTTTAFQIQNASSGSVLNVDTTNTRIGINNSYTAMSTPTGLAVGAATSGGSLTASTTYYYKVTAIDSAGGETTASSEASGATTTNRTLPVTWTAVTGASGYKVYRSTTTNTEVYLTTVPTNSFTDSGTLTIGSANPPSSGTAYTSSNVTSSQLQLSVGGLGTPTGQVYISGTAPQVISTQQLGSQAYAVTVSGRYAYVATFASVRVYDVSNPVAPVSISTITLPSSIGTMEVAGRYLIVVSSNSTNVRIYDVSNPASPTLTGSVALTGNAVAAVSGRYLFVGANGASFIYAYDLSNPASPILVGTIADTADPLSMYVQGKYLYVTHNTSTVMRVYDISDPANISQVGSVSTLGTKVIVQGRYAYTISTTSFNVFDVSNPTAPASVASLSLTSPNGLAIQGRYAYVSNSTAGNMYVIDIANPSTPVLQSTVANGGTPFMAVQGRYLYGASATSPYPFKVYDLGGMYSQSFEAGSIETSSLGVNQNLTVNQNTSIAGGLFVGQSAEIAGGLGVYSSLTTKGTVTLQSTTNSAAALQVQASSGETVLGVNTSTNTVHIGYIPAPGTLSTSTSATGGTLAAAIYYYKVTALDSFGYESLPSPETSRLTSGSTSTVTVNWTAVPGAVTYRVYRGTATGGENVYYTTATNSYIDTGAANTAGTVPTISASAAIHASASGMTIQPATNSTSTFKIQNATGAINALTVDTTGSTTVTIGGALTVSGATTLNSDVSVAAGKYISLAGGATGTRPSSPTDGMLYYDTTTKQLLVYDATSGNAKWQADSSSATKIVAASNSSQTAKDGADYVADGENSSGSGTGTIDGDQIQIQAAVDAIASTGGVVYLTEGTYTVDAGITLPNNVTLAGSGNATVIQLGNFGSTSVAIDVVTNSDTSTGAGVTIRNLQFSGRKSLNTAGVQRGVYLNGMGGSLRAGATITGVMVTGFRDSGIVLNASANSTIVSNIVVDNTSSGIRLQASSTNVTISGNVTRGHGTAGINLSGATNNTITGNTSTSDFDGVYLQANSHYNTITGNTVTTSTSLGIYLLLSNSNTVSGNKIHDSGLATTNNGIVLDAADSNTVVGNNITDTSASTNNYAINVFNNTSDNTYLADNTLGGGSINDVGVGTIYANQMDSSGNLINRSQGGGTSFGTTSAAVTVDIQGGLRAAQLPVPSSPTLAVVGTTGATTLRYQITALDGLGETTGSTITQVTNANATLTGSNRVDLSWTPIGGAVQYKIYRCSGAACTPALLATVAGNLSTYSDTANGSPSGALPTANTTGAVQGGSSLTLGTASATNGSIVVKNSSNANTVTLVSGATSSSYTLMLPTALGSSGDCLKDSNGSGVLAFGACTNGVTTVGALDGGTANANGATITTTTIYLQSASTSFAGLVNTTTQSFAGNKTFTGNLVQSGSTTLQTGTGAISLNGDVTVAAGKYISLVGGITSTRPASPTDGMLYYDTTTKQLLVYDATSGNAHWKADKSSNTIVVGTSASGGTSTAVASKAPDGADYVNTSTSSADETIQAAINSLPSTGGTVYLMEGTYIIDGSISIPSNVTLIGAGISTVIKLVNGVSTSFNAIANSDGTNGNSAFTISNLKLDGNKSNVTSGTQQGISLLKAGSGSGNTSTIGVTISQVTIVNFTDHGIQMVTSNNNKIMGVTSQNNDGTGVRIASSNYNSLTDIIATGNAVSGIHLNAASNNVVANSIVAGNTTIGLNLQASANNNRITGNNANNNGQNGFVVNGSSQNTLANNVSSSNGTTGFTLSNSSESNTLTGNESISNSSTGYFITSSSHRNTLSMNVAKSNTGIGVSIQTDSNTINGNLVASNTNNGIFVDGTNNLVTNNKVYDNGGTGANSSISVSPTANSVSVLNNDITDTAGTAYAINVQAGAVGIILGGNRYSGTGATSISDSGTGTIYNNQTDSTGNLINRSGGGGFAIGGTGASVTTDIQGGLRTTALPTPSAPTVTKVGSHTSGATARTYQITALDGLGETLPSTGTTVTATLASLTGTDSVTISWTPIGGAVQYKIYTCTGSSCTPTVFLTTVAGNLTSYSQTANGSPSGALPTANTTGGLQAASSLALGTASTTSGSITFSNSTNANTVRVVSGATSTSYTLTLPTALSGVSGDCIKDSNGSGVLVFGSCGAGSGVATVGAIDTQTKSANGAVISGTTIYLQTADSSSVGLVSTTTQAFAGAKTFNAAVTLAAGASVSAGQSITLVGGITSTRPASPTDGMLYYDTTTKQLLVYDATSGNTGWRADRKSSTKVVSTSASGGASSAVASVAADAADYVNTSTTSAQTVINSALTAVGTAGGGTVYLMEGTYIIDGAISIPSNTTLMGAGAGTIIKLSGAVTTGINAVENKYITDVRNSVPSPQANYDITVRDLIIDGNRSVVASGNQNGISLNNIGASTAAGALGARITNVTITSFRQYGILLDTTTKVLIQGSSIRDNTTTGIRNTTANSADRAQLLNNVIEANGTGIDWISDWVEIANNVLRSNTTVAINVRSAADVAKITGNMIAENQVGVTSAGDGMLFTSNMVSTNTAEGLTITAGINSQFTGNRIWNNGAATSSSNILISAGTNNSFVGNSIFDTAGSGYAINLSTSSVVSTYLADNQYSGTGAASINDAGTGTIYANQLDSSGNLINRSTGGGLSVGKTSAAVTTDIQGGMRAGQLPTPSAPSVTKGGTGTGTTWGYKVTALDGLGETLASTETTLSHASTLNGTNYSIISWSAVGGAVQYKVYRTTAGGTPATTGLIGTLAGNVLTLNDTGLSASGSTPTVNTTGALQGGSSLTLGTSSATNGSIVLKNSGNSNTVTIVSGATSGSYTLTLPTALGSSGDCLKDTTGAGVLGFGSCGAGISPTLQNVYDNSSSPATILLANSKNFVITAADTATDPSIIFNLQCVTSCSTNGYFGIQNAGTDVFRVNPDGSIRLGTATNNLTLSTTWQPTYTGTARRTKTIKLAPEYEGAIITGTSTAGTMSSDFCSGTSRKSVNTSVCAATEEHTYYDWSSTASGETYDIYVSMKLPSDFDGFSSSTAINMYGWRTDATVNSVKLSLYNSSGTECGTAGGTQVGGTGAWAYTALGGDETACTFSADEDVVWRVRVVADTGDTVRAGEIVYSYFSKF